VDTAVLRDLLSYDGPFASVYFDASHDTEDADKESELRWRTVRQRLVEAGADERTVTALEDVVRATRPAGRAGRFLIAAGEAVPVDEYLPEPPTQPMVRVSRLPYFVPLAAGRPRIMPHVVVLVDKTGAELRAVGADGQVLAERTVEGTDHPVHKVRGAGWAHRRVQQHTEETVKHNIARVAEETAQLVRETSAQLLIITGDVEPEAMLRKAIPPACAQIATSIRTGRPHDQASRDALAAEIEQVVATAWEARHQDALDRFNAELAREDGLAVQGLQATTAAARESNIDTLLVNDAGIGERTVWIGSEPNLVALDRSELHTFGVSGRAEVRADEALPAAAIAIGADVLADGKPLTDGVGALLRHR
jgi:Bacterial archaeo-eukaryotic release factor family 2